MMRASSPIPVILNLFQDPSGRMFDRRVCKHNDSVQLPDDASARAAKWILKQVQDDGLREGRA
jgi:hypothetical protein